MEFIFHTNVESIRELFTSYLDLEIWVALKMHVIFNNIITYKITLISQAILYIIPHRKDCNPLLKLRVSISKIQ